MVIWKCIQPRLSYFIVGQGKECTYVYFHILYWFQLCFKTLCKHFKHNIKILFGANSVCINKSSWNNYQNKIIFQMVRVLVNESESLQCMIIKTQIHQCSPLGCKIKHSRMKECSETMLLQISFVGIYFYIFTKNLKTRLKRTRKICLSLTKF